MVKRKSKKFNRCLTRIGYLTRIVVLNLLQTIISSFKELDNGYIFKEEYLKIKYRSVDNVVNDFMIFDLHEL